MIGFALQWALGRLTSAFRLALRYPLHAALIVAVVACVWLWRGKEAARDERDDARAETAALVESTRRASAEAEAKARAAIAAVEKRYQEKASHADQAYSVALADANARAADYIARNRVRPNGGSAPGGTSAAATGGSPGGAGGPSEGSELVEVTADDVRVCTVNYERLKAAREWALGLD